MPKTRPKHLYVIVVGLSAAVGLGVGCRPAAYRREADRAALEIIRQKQIEVLGRSEPFTIGPAADALRRRLLLGQNLPYSATAVLGTDRLQPIAHWPEKDYPAGAGPGSPLPAPWQAGEPLRMKLNDALRVAARNNRDYQSHKEDIFRTALDLDLERDAFDNTFAGMIDSLYSTNLSGDRTVAGLENSAEGQWSRRLKTGAALSGRIVLDLVKLLTLDRSSSFGIFADATISIPLLRGAGRHIAAEPLTQAERDVVYAIQSFERFKRTLAVRVASDYLGVLEQQDQVRNAEDNYRRLIASDRRARRMAEEGRLSQIQVDQARQDRLRARDRWVRARQRSAGELDRFKIELGLPADAGIELEREELERLAATAKEAVAGRPPSVPAPSSQPATQATADDAPIVLVPPSREDGGRLELKPAEGIALALENRMDLRTVLGRITDAQRGVAVAADALRAGLTLTGTGQAGGRRGIGSAGQDDAKLRPEKGVYTGGLFLDLPLERTAERNAYRDSLIVLERTVRRAQELEDQIKLEVRNGLRELVAARESFTIQTEAVEVARRRVKSTELFLKANRVQIRDVLEAQESLVSAQNALTAALVAYRVTELELQRDMGVLEITETGVWNEYRRSEDR